MGRLVVLAPKLRKPTRGLGKLIKPRITVSSYLVTCSYLQYIPCTEVPLLA